MIVIAEHLLFFLYIELLLYYCGKWHLRFFFFFFKGAFTLL